jgi:flavodoxin|tara:strand:+ start:38 stop:643 length:606 start_codon:yes stop_codon:yes gene_type:complete
MALTKVQAEGVNLADTFAFSGTVSGGGMDLLLSVNNTSGSPAYYDISSTYINSTYDNYYLVGYFEGNADTRYLYVQVFVGGVVQDSSGTYGYETTVIGANDQHDNTNSDTHLMSAQTGGQGGEDGEGTNVSMTFQNANNTMAPFCVTGSSSYHNTSANHSGSNFSGSMKPANRANVVNGLRLKMHTGDLTNFRFKLYGLKD